MRGAASSTGSSTSIVASSHNGGASTSGSAGRRVLVVSIHDVAPPLAPRVRALWDLCESRGLTPALLVVPNWHGVAPLADAPEVVSWIRRCQDAGAEVFLHGERHDEAGLTRGWGDEWRAWGRTAREGEFLTLEEPAARERIARGLALFRELGLQPAGFIPPAWLARSGCARAVSALGLRYTEDTHAVSVHEPGRVRRIESPVVRWSGRTAIRARGSAAVAALRWRAQRREPCVRIALHPGDLAHPVTARSIGTTLDRWLGDRPAVRYADL